MQRRAIVNILIFFAILFCSYDVFAGETVGASDFLKKGGTSNLILSGVVSKVDSKILSKRWTLVKGIDISVDKVYYASSLDLLDKKPLVCIFIHPARMIAPFYTTAADETIPIKVGNDIFVYLEMKGKDCWITHLSKVVQGNVTFPEYKEQKSFTVKRAEFEKMIQAEVERENKK